MLIHDIYKDEVLKLTLEKGIHAVSVNLLCCCHDCMTFANVFS